MIIFPLQLLPNLSEDTRTSHILHIFNESIQYVLGFFGLLVTFGVFFLKRSKIGTRSTIYGEIANITNISVVGIIFRYCTMMTLGHLVRAITYTLTSLPGKFITDVLSMDIINYLDTSEEKDLTNMRDMKIFGL